MRYFFLLALISLTIINCKKDVAKRDDLSNDDVITFEEPNLFKYEEPPCNPDENSSSNYYDSKINYGNAYFSSSPIYLSSGYVIKGSAYQLGEHSVEFRSKPKTQKYVTTFYPNIDNDNQVYVYARYGGVLAYNYKGSIGDTVYVKVLDETNEIYSVTFCNLKFSTGSSSAPVLYFYTDGNLTTN